MDFHKIDASIRDSRLSRKEPEKVPVSHGFYIFEEKDYADSIWKLHIPEHQHHKYLQYRHEWHRRPNDQDPGSAPLSVIIELNSGCNLSCNMCYTITDAFKESVVGDQRIMPWGMVTDIIDECDELGVPSLLFSWRGESTLYRSIDTITNQSKDFADILAYAVRKDNILEVTCLTHGQDISEDLAERIVLAQPNWISFSIDGQGNTYNTIRKPQWARRTGQTPDMFSKVLETIKKMKEFKECNSLSRPLIRSNTIYPCISDDPSGYRTLLKSAGVDYVTVNELLEWSLHKDGNISMDYVEENWSCQYPFQRLTISANGIIVPCNGAVHEESGLVVGSYSSGYNKGKSKESTANTIQELVQAQHYSIREAWISPEINYIRDMHSSGKRLSINPGCRNCNHGLKKKGVDWLPSNWNQDSMTWENND